MPTTIPSWAWWALAALAATVLTGDTRIPDRLALLRSLHPQAQQRFLALFLALEAAGWTVVLTSAKRAGTSDYHGFGLACDFNVVNQKTGQQLRSTVDKATWEASGVPALIRAHGFRWGGDFVTPWVYQGQVHAAYDPVHVDLGKTYDISQLRAKALRLAGSPAELVAFDGRKVPLVA